MPSGSSRRAVEPIASALLLLVASGATSWLVLGAEPVAVIAAVVVVVADGRGLASSPSLVAVAAEVVILGVGIVCLVLARQRSRASLVSR